MSQPHPSIQIQCSPRTNKRTQCLTHNPEVTDENLQSHSTKITKTTVFKHRKSSHTVNPRRPYFWSTDLTAVVRTRVIMDNRMSSHQKCSSLVRGNRAFYTREDTPSDIRPQLTKSSTTRATFSFGPIQSCDSLCTLKAWNPTQKWLYCHRDGHGKLQT